MKYDFLIFSAISRNSPKIFNVLLDFIHTTSYCSTKVKSKLQIYRETDFVFTHVLNRYEVQLIYSCSLWLIFGEYFGKKANCQMLLKLKAVVNFTIILQAEFALKFSQQKITKPNCE